MILTPCVVDALSIPVATAGGIADGRGLVAALALGAEAVQMGSAFLATYECHVHDDFKNAIVDAKDNGTLITQRAIGRLSRSLRNPFSEKMKELDRRGDVAEIKAFLGEAMNKGDKTNTPTIDVQYQGQMEGDLENGEAALGQTAGLIREVRSAGDVVRAVVAQATEVLGRWDRRGSPGAESAPESLRSRGGAV